jgi:hypothetical protein
MNVVEVVGAIERSSTRLQTRRSVWHWWWRFFLKTYAGKKRVVVGNQNMLTGTSVL